MLSLCSCEADANVPLCEDEISGVIVALQYAFFENLFYTIENLSVITLAFPTNGHEWVRIMYWIIFIRDN